MTCGSSLRSERERDKCVLLSLAHRQPIRVCIENHEETRRGKSMRRSKEKGAFAHNAAAETPSDLIYDGLRVRLQPAPFLIRTVALVVDYGIISMAILSAMLVAFLVLFSGTLSLAYLSAAGDSGDTTAALLLTVVF